MIERVEVEDAANPLPKLAIEPALELERALSFGWIRWGKRGLGTVLVDVVDDGAGALNDAPSILKQLCLQRRYPKIDADRKGAEIALKRPWGKHQGVEGLRSMSLRVKAIELEAGILFTALLKSRR